VHAQTLLGRLPVRAVPFNVGVPVQTGQGTYKWAGQAAPKADGSFSFATVSLTIAKAVGIVVVTKELLAAAAPGSEAALEDELANGVREYLDQQFTDPAVAAVADVNPASVTNGITPIAPSGTTTAALVADLGKLIGQFFTANPSATSAALLMTPAVAAMLAPSSQGTLNVETGGTYAGIPTYVSAALKTAIVMLDASQILLAAGGIEVAESDQATLQLNTAPDNPPTAATVNVSLWQQNLVGLRAERYVNWQRAKNSAVVLISPTAYVPGT
jgi:hypothetical protein